jgi:hypothetical protein
LSESISSPLGIKPKPDAVADVVLKLVMPFELESRFKPRGDQRQAIAKLLKSVEA